MKPITIRKSLVGLAIIYILGAAALAVFVTIALLDLGNRVVMVSGAFLVLIVTLVQAYVYNQSYLELSADGIRIVAWSALFFSNVAETQWNEIQDVDVKKAGFLPQLFDYGTLLVQTAGTERNLRIPMVPQVEHWRDYILQQSTTTNQLS